MLCLLAAPAPVANAIGKTPRVKASEVIQIGLNRIFAPLIAASAMLLPLCKCSFIANSTIKIAFLAAKPINKISPI